MLLAQSDMVTAKTLIVNRSSDCTAFGDMTQSLIGGIGMTGDSGTADVQQVVRGKILSMVYMPDE